MRKFGYVPALDGVRALAVLSVIGFHAVKLPFGGDLGVDVFFVLSGFLITTLLLTEHGRTGTISLRAFYRRRALRLLPALFAMLAVYLSVVGALYTAGEWSAERAHAALRSAGLGVFYVANFAAAYSDHLTGNLNHLWSLATEEQFYLVLPLLLVVCLRLGLGARGLAVVIGTLLVLVVAHRTQLVLSGGYAAARHAFYGPDCRTDGLIVGCLAGVAYTQGWARLASRAASVGLVATCLILALGGPFVPRMLVILPLLNLAVALVILEIARRPDAFPRLQRRPVAYLGRISYGLYLWHPLTLAVFGPVGALVAVPLAAASHRFVERPALALRYPTTSSGGASSPAAS